MRKGIGFSRLVGCNQGQSRVQFRHLLMKRPIEFGGAESGWFRSILAGGCCLLAVGAVADSTSITDVDIDAEDRCWITYGPEPPYYYLLGHAASVTGRYTFIRIQLGGMLGAGQFVEPGFSAEQGYFAVQQVSVLTALDSDGDGRDDVAELTFGSDPVDPASRPTFFVVAASPVRALVPGEAQGVEPDWNTVVATPPVRTTAPGIGPISEPAWSVVVSAPPVRVVAPSEGGHPRPALNIVVAKPPVKVEYGLPP